jgi:hypothetical protein
VLEYSKQSGHLQNGVEVGAVTAVFKDLKKNLQKCGNVTCDVHRFMPATLYCCLLIYDNDYV